jgi:hypothetical protein
MNKKRRHPEGGAALQLIPATCFGANRRTLPAEPGGRTCGV